MNYYEIIESLVTDSDFLFTMAGCGTAPEMTPSDTKPAKNPVADSLENLQNILKSGGKVGYGEAIYENVDCRRDMEKGTMFFQHIGGDELLSGMHGEMFQFIFGLLYKKGKENCFLVIG